MVIGFDADDTLWENERNFLDMEEKLFPLLSPWYRGTDADLKAEIYKTEISNLQLFGYGAKGFTLSLLETALRLSGNKVSGDVIERIIAMGKELIMQPVVLFEDTRETLAALVSRGYRLLYITKGDLLDQKRKLENSGLREFFSSVEVMSAKTVPDYEELFKRLNIDPCSFMMVGDSLKSDILPVLELGGWAVHIPGDSHWQHEHVEEEITHERFLHAQKISEVISMLEEKDQTISGEENNAIRIHTDGGCLGNPGPGGWAYIISSGFTTERKAGGERQTTNNKMELTAVIKALENLMAQGFSAGTPVEVYTDSRYVQNGITSWIHNWVKNGWKTASKQPVKNKDLWIKLKELSDMFDVTWKWVKGHAGDPLNEACDAMVREEMNKFPR